MSSCQNRGIKLTKNAPDDMLAAYKRWRHSRGFGIHSPFAYDLVRLAIHPGKEYGYYGYTLIERTLLTPSASSHTRRDRRDARLLLGILAQLRCRRVILPKDLPLMAAAAEGAGARILTSFPGKFKEGDFLLSRLDGATSGGSDSVFRAIASGTPVMILDPSPSLLKTGCSAMTDGLVMIGTRILLLIPRPGMALTTYTMRF